MVPGTPHAKAHVNYCGLESENSLTEPIEPARCLIFPLFSQQEIVEKNERFF